MYPNKTGENPDNQKLYACLFCDGVNVSQTELTEKDEFKNEWLTRPFVECVEGKFSVAIGTESEQLATFELEPVTFKTGRKGYANRKQLLIKGKTCHFRANLSKLDVENSYALTVGVILPEPDATKPKLTWAMSPSTQLFSNTTARPTTKKIRLKGKQPRLNFHFIDMKKSSEAF